MITFDRVSDAHPRALAGSLAEHQHRRTRVTALALTAGTASPERIAAGTAIDAGGLLPDTAPVNSWTQRVHEVDPMELLEVQLCNMTAPFILVSRLRAGAGRVTGAAHVRRQRVGDGGRSSAAATRARAIRTPTWPRPR